MPATNPLHTAWLIGLPHVEVTSPVGPVSSIRWVPRPTDLAFRILVPLALFALAQSAQARLPGIAPDEFLLAAPCAYYGTVSSVIEETSSRTNSVIREVHAVLTGLTLEKGQGCPSMESMTLRLYAEYHSSHPVEGQQALFFPKRTNGVWLEAVYGRSYWPIEASIEETPAIRVDWRNDFLSKVVPVRCFPHLEQATAVASLSKVLSWLRSGKSQSDNSENCLDSAWNELLRDLAIEQKRLEQALD